MCDYSLEILQSRPARVGDHLAIDRFHGFASVNDPGTVVCLRPGTELVVAIGSAYTFHRPAMEPGEAKGTLEMKAGPTFKFDGPARFRKFNEHHEHTLHDFLELDDGRIVAVGYLVQGSTAAVIQLPVDEDKMDQIAKLPKPRSKGMRAVRDAATRAVATVSATAMFWL